MTTNETPKIEHLSVGDLKPHPKNYKQHPDEQLVHIAESIREHGFYRNVVIARDNVILAGHGVVQAVAKLGMFAPLVPCLRLDIASDDPRALKLLVGDNEIGKLGETNDRTLTGILRELMSNGDLLGTGYDEQTSAMLVFVSRPIEEIEDKNEAAEWIGMPEFDVGEKLYRLNVMFRSQEERDAFIDQLAIKISDRNRDGTIVSGWWPPRDTMDRSHVLFVDDDDEQSQQGLPL